MLQLRYSAHSTASVKFLPFTHSFWATLQSYAFSQYGTYPVWCCQWQNITDGCLNQNKCIYIYIFWIVEDQILILLYLTGYHLPSEKSPRYLFSISISYPNQISNDINQWYLVLYSNLIFRATLKAKNLSKSHPLSSSSTFSLLEIGWKRKIITRFVCFVVRKMNLTYWCIQMQMYIEWITKPKSFN